MRKPVDQVPSKSGEKGNALDRRPNRGADVAHASPYSGIVLALCFLSFAAYLFCSAAVRFVLAEIARLIGKFLS